MLYGTGTCEEGERERVVVVVSSPPTTDAIGGVGLLYRSWQSCLDGWGRVAGGLRFEGGVTKQAPP